MVVTVSQMDTILLVEDNADIRMILAEALFNAGYRVNSVYTGTDALKELRSFQYDLVLLDLMLPYKSGDEVLKELRSFCDVPVIIISAKDLVSTKIDLLKLGADDYITKPFDLNEVTARVESNLRRFKKQMEHKKLTYKDLILDDEAKEITVNSSPLDLTSTEYDLLFLLMNNQDRVFTKATLSSTIWHEDCLANENILKTHISNLRSKLKKANPEQEYIETVWGVGYRMSRN